MMGKWGVGLSKSGAVSLSTSAVIGWKLTRPCAGLPSHKLVFAKNPNHSVVRNITCSSHHQHSLKMATELTVQSERAYQKQPHIFLNSKTKVKTARPGKNGRRWVRFLLLAALLSRGG